MRQPWLALMVVMGMATSAHAIKVPPCSCPARVVLPERSPLDITAVPTNAKVWILEDGLGAVHRPTRVPPDDLLSVRVIDHERGPHAHVRDDKLGIDFVTLEQRDDTPPTAPADVTISLVADAFGHVTTLKLFGRFDADTALVRVDIRDSLGVVSHLTTPDRLFLCAPGFLVMDDSVSVEVHALDIAGNESAPFVTTTEIAHSTKAESPCSEHRSTAIDDGGFTSTDRCGEIVVVYAFLYGIFLLCWAAFVAGRAGLVKRYPPEPVPLLVAECVTTRQLRWYALWAAMQVVGVIGLSAADSDGLAIMLAPFAFTTLVRLALARRVRRMLERAGTTAARHGRWLVVTSPDGSAKLWASNQDFVQAARAGIPRSIAR
jgi:hypothetical protein